MGSFCSKRKIKPKVKQETTVEVYPPPPIRIPKFNINLSKSEKTRKTKKVIKHPRKITKSHTR